MSAFNDPARRRFLKVGVAASAPAGLPLSAEARTSSVRRYLRLGRTEPEISDISFGSSRLRDDQDDLLHQGHHGQRFLCAHASDAGLTRERPGHPKRQAAACMRFWHHVRITILTSDVKLPGPNHGSGARQGIEVAVLSFDVRIHRCC